MPAQPRPLAAIFVGGLIAGAIDLLYAIVVYSSHHPLLIPKHIATGLLGASAYNGGTGIVLLGISLHFVIALGAATVYYLVSRKLTFLITRAVPCGLIYGALVYAFMHTVVLPLSNVPHSRHERPVIYKICEFAEHCLCVGLPIALSVRRYSGTRDV